MSGTAPKRQVWSRVALGLALVVLRLVTRSGQLGVVTKQTDGDLRLDDELPDAEANLDVPGFKHEPDGNPEEVPDELNLVKGPPGPINDLTIGTDSATFNIEFLGSRANGSLRAGKGFHPSIVAALAVFLMSSSTVLPVVLAPTSTGFVSVFVPVSWLVLSVLIVLLTYFGPRRPRTS